MSYYIYTKYVPIIYYICLYYILYMSLLYTYKYVFTIYVPIIDKYVPAIDIQDMSILRALAYRCGTRC